MRLLFFISRKRMNKTGLCPVYLRITINNIPAEFSTGIFVAPSNWNSKTKKVKGNEDYNDEIYRLRTEAWNARSALLMAGKSVTSKRIRAMLTGESGSARTSLAVLFDSFIKFHQGATHGNSETTISYYKRRWRKVLTLISPETDPHEISPADAKRFAETLRMNHAANYAAKVLELIKQVIDYGITFHDVERNPFEGVTIRRPRPKIISLDPDQFAQLAHYQFAQRRLQEVSDLFQMQSLTGMVYADLMAYDPSLHLHNGMILIDRDKSRRDEVMSSRIPLLPQVKALLDKYGGRAPRISLGKYNSYLKEVSEIVGLPVALTTNIARKTFSELFLDAGGSAEALAAIYGHRDVRTTFKYYAKASSRKIRREGELMSINLPSLSPEKLTHFDNESHAHNESA